MAYKTKKPVTDLKKKIFKWFLRTNEDSYRKDRQSSIVLGVDRVDTPLDWLPHPRYSQPS